MTRSAKEGSSVGIEKSNRSPVFEAIHVSRALLIKSDRATLTYRVQLQFIVGGPIGASGLRLLPIVATIRCGEAA